MDTWTYPVAPPGVATKAEEDEDNVVAPVLPKVDDN